MSTSSISAQAAQAAAQGQQLLSQYQNQANQSTNDYNTYQGQADTANKNVNDYTTAMQGTYNADTGVGNAGSAYQYDLNNELGKQGYSEDQMNAARSNLNQATGALSAYSDFANQAASKWGLNAGGFAAANSGALSGLNNNIASNQGVVNGLEDLYKTAQTGAGTFTGNVVQGEQNTLAGLQDVYTNASNQRDAAASNMQYYSNLAQQQGSLNAQEQQYYAAAVAAYASATQAQAQAALLAKQAVAEQQQVDMTSAYMKSPAYQTYLGNSSTGSNGGLTVTTAKPQNSLQVTTNPQGGNMSVIQGSGLRLQ